VSGCSLAYLFEPLKPFIDGGFSGDKVLFASSLLLEGSYYKSTVRLPSIGAELAHLQRNGERLNLAQHKPRSSIFSDTII
jgi:hypothetical protein